MKLVTYRNEESARLGLLARAGLYDLQHLDKRLPSTMRSFLEGGARSMELAFDAENYINNRADFINPIIDFSLESPIPNPTSLRDAYAFPQHVETARKNRGLDMIPAFYKFPVFYFSNHQAIFGEGDIICERDHFNRLDFELEVAVVLNKQGKNIAAHKADEYIAGYMIMNDFSARTLQMDEMQLSLGPAKGKDFATALGPWLVTPDELETYRCETPSGHVGNVYALRMSAAVNNKAFSKGMLSDMHWTFAEIIERCSYGVNMFPGDVIGSGTVGTGCLLELNGTARRENPNFRERWLMSGDVVELEVSGLGVLKNRIRRNDVDEQ
ncbi:fumarylacetoacetate hydrolase family protein [Olivibacter sp. CPCC 100613]|uniref:fumarylacetoacetate hydrolase family protein n=1 Tax=Olivibacter sp. CPCC 100613 TaxID=3079931 RepID=UPI002FF82AB1